MSDVSEKNKKLVLEAVEIASSRPHAQSIIMSMKLDVECHSGQKTASLGPRMREKNSRQINKAVTRA